MEKQFAAIQTNRDSLFSTPGRFVHICMEMNMRLTSVEYVVFDEADGLFQIDGPGGPVEGDPGQAARHQADGPVLCHNIQDVG